MAMFSPGSSSMFKHLSSFHRFTSSCHMRQKHVHESETHVSNVTNKAEL